MEAAKRTAGPRDLTDRGALTAEARAEVIRSCQAAWAQMPGDQKELYLAIMRDKREARAAQDAEQHSGAVRPQVAASTFSTKSAWGMGSKACLIHPAVVQQAFAQGDRLPSNAELYNSNEYFVDEPLSGDLLGDGIELEGCPLLGRNVCRRHPDIQSIDVVARMLARLARSVGAAAASSNDILIMLEGAELKPGVAGNRCRMFCLLSEAAFSPASEIFTICEICSHGDFSADELLFPFEVRVGLEACRLPLPGALPAMCIKHRTSDEVALAAVGSASRWRAVALEYQIVSTMVMSVSGLAAAVFDSSAAGGLPGNAKIARDRANEMQSIDALN